MSETFRLGEAPRNPHKFLINIGRLPKENPEPSGIDPELQVIFYKAAAYITGNTFRPATDQEKRSMHQGPGLTTYAVESPNRETMKEFHHILRDVLSFGNKANISEDIIRRARAIAKLYDEHNKTTEVPDPK